MSGSAKPTFNGLKPIGRWYALSRLPSWPSLAQSLWLILFFANPGCTNSAAADLRTQRLTFQSFEQALKQDAKVPLDSIADYPLYPYLLYQKLRHRLSQSPSHEVHAFLEKYADSPLAARLRNAWLHHLAKEQRWTQFLRDDQPTKDVALRCWRRQALLHTGQQEQALQGIDKIWMSGTSLPKACDPLFKIWKTQGGFTPERLWQRFGLAIAKGEHRLARYLQKHMSGRDRIAAELWFKIDKNPKLIKDLDTLRFGKSNPRLGEILLYELRRWSRRDSVSAAHALAGVKQRYPLPQQPLQELERQLAVYLASRGHPDALQRLTALPPSLVDTQVREWRIRVALQQGDWQATLQWLDQLTPEEHAQLRWQYWRARALEASGQQQQAQHLYQQIASHRDYYGFLAAERSDLPYQFNDKPVAVSEAAVTTMQRLPGMQRARELFLLERYWEARLEWRYTLQQLSQQDLLAAARLAHDWGWHSQVIATLGRAGYWDDLALRFPLPYRNHVLTSARSKGIDPAWVYAIMRQESGFQRDAKSPAGALGLMQIMPTTGQRIARDLQRPLTSRYALLQADTSIRFGTHYLRKNLDHFQGSPLLATAAYNAGPYRVAEWLPAQGKIEADRWIETIPYFETRKYVQRIIEYTIIYAHRLGSANSLQLSMKPVLPSS